jgi:tetratricopeptide (TPR) repeat protein/tRNA A-37 threonylcarbamoyl transferase component Bud32
MIGHQISHFYIVRTLGTGGMGVVYEAQDTEFPRSVAVKLLKEELSKDADAVRRFKREARLASSLNHPNICAILEVGEDDGQSFIAMELLEGRSLKSKLVTAPLPAGEIIDIASQAADALAAAHDRGIIHRDITPGNIFLTADGTVKLLDFGLAKHFPSLDDDALTTDELTRQGAVAGTIHYMSPEQLGGAVVADYRCDFFALGSVMYQMATGARPFDIQPRSALMSAIRAEPHLPMRKLAPHQPLLLERIIDRLLAKNPEDRYQSAATVRADLDALRREVPHDADQAAADPPAARARRHAGEPEAYHALKRGQHLWKTAIEGGWRAAIEYFQHATNRDPQFALAHVALASAYNFLGYYCLIKPSFAFTVAARAAARAVAIEPALGAAHIEMGVARFGGDWDWDGAEQAFRRGLSLDPTNAAGHIYYSWLLLLLGREDAAYQEAERGHALAPSSRFVVAARAQTLYLGRRYDEAIELCSDCLRFDPNFVFATHIRGLCFLRTSRRDEAIADLQQAATLSSRTPFYLGLLGRCYGECGMRERALALIDELNQQPPDTYVAPQCYVYIYAALGERERALAYQEKAYEDGASPFNYLFPGIRELYALSPHHKKRLEQMRLIL